MSTPLRPLKAGEFYETLGNGDVTVLRAVTPFGARRGKGSGGGSEQA